MIADARPTPGCGRDRRSTQKAAGLALALILAVPAASADVPYRVIVNTKVAGNALPKDTLAQIYLGRVKRWSDGRPISAVDLPSTSPVRVAFTTNVLDMTMLAVRSHWMQILPGGDRPPLTRPSDDAVIAFVSEQAGGVGYVSGTASLPESVKVVTVE